MNLKYSNEVIIDYTNWKGVRRPRRILPMGIKLAHNEYHPEEQWLLEAMDLEDGYTVKTFSLKDVHSWASVLLSESVVEKWQASKPAEKENNARTS